MAEQAQVPIFDYPVLSDHRVNAGRDLAEAEPGQRVFGDEDVRLETGDFEPGDDDLGSVTIEEIPTTRPGQGAVPGRLRLRGQEGADRGHRVPAG